MATQHLQPIDAVAGSSLQIAFGGDNVRLAGQIDYTRHYPGETGYPIIFIIQHATCTSRTGYRHYATIGSDAGCATFRWDKRGTGSSGGGGGGSVHIDTLGAYNAALAQPAIDPDRAIIIAQNEGTLLLSELYEDIVAKQKPRGVLLVGNMLDEKAILKLDTDVHIVTSKNDWNAWQIYARDASVAHSKHYKRETTYYVAPNTNRHLMYTNGGTFHLGAANSIRAWLKHVSESHA